MSYSGKSQEQKKKISSLILLSVAAALLALLIIFDFTGYIRTDKRILAVCAVCLLVYGAALIAAVGKPEPKRFILPALLFIFIMYLDLVLYFTIFDPEFGRGNTSFYSLIKNSAAARSSYNSLYVNFKPFKSIYNVYIRGFSRDILGAMTTSINIIGNLCVFMPLAFFMPIFFGSMRKWYVFFIVPILFSCLIEGAQYLLMCGSCDIDDIILNAGGAMIFCFILKIPPIKRFLSLITLGAFPSEKS